MANYRFSGHETFHCRSFWLKKGYDFQKGFGSNFGSDEALIQLGVGKNMITAINHWMKAFGIKSQENEITELGDRLFSDNGYDPYMEDIGTLWLLHFHLIRNVETSSIYRLIFNDFRKNRVSTEFTPNQVFDYVSKRCVQEGVSYSEKVLKNDIKVFIKNYVASSKASKSLEDDFSAALIQLNLLSVVPDVIINGEKLYQINYSERKDLPLLIFLYALIDQFRDEESISFKDVQSKISDMFLCNREGTEHKLEELQEMGFIVYKQDAGRKEIQFKKKLNTWKILSKYYG